jgi:hypothetical protein
LSSKPEVKSSNVSMESSSTSTNSTNGEIKENLEC